VYTYDTFWEESDITWASRWDAYLKMPGGRVHWFSILNSLMVVLVMSSIVAMIMLRTIRRDLARYESILGDTGEAPPPPPSLPSVITSQPQAGLKQLLSNCVHGHHRGLSTSGALMAWGCL